MTNTPVPIRLQVRPSGYGMQTRLTLEECCTDIRLLEPASHRSQEVVNAPELLKGLLAPELSEGLEALHGQFDDCAYSIITENPLYLDMLEGRGKCHQGNFNSLQATVYTKGTGSVMVIHNNRFGGGKNSWYSFGENNGQLFFDSIDNKFHYPRIWGAQSLEWAKLEILYASRIFYGLSEGLGIKTIEDALNAGITVPLNAVRFPSLTAHFAEQAQEAIAASKYWSGTEELGSCALVVPASLRLKLLSLDPKEEYLFKKGGQFADMNYSPSAWDRICRLDRPAAYGAVGRCFRNLVKYAYLITSPASMHDQNFYAAPASACCQADNSDMLALEELSRDERRLAVYFAIFELAPGYRNPRAVVEGYLNGLLDNETKAKELSAIWPVLGQEIMLAIADYLLDSVEPGHVQKVCRAYADMGRKLDGGETLEFARSESKPDVTTLKRQMSKNILYLAHVPEDEMAGWPAESIMAEKRNSDYRDILAYLKGNASLSGNSLAAKVSAITDKMLAGELESFWSLRTDMSENALSLISIMLQKDAIRLMGNSRWNFTVSMVCGAYGQLGIVPILKEPDFQESMRIAADKDTTYAMSALVALKGLGARKLLQPKIVADEFIGLLQSRDRLQLYDWQAGLAGRGLVDCSIPE